MTISFISHTAEMTHQAGHQLSQALQPGDLVALSGDLGTGKTVLSQGICEGLSVDDVVNSPTYTIINIYEGRLPVYHFDLYRLGDVSELDELGYEEYFWGNGLTIVEWAERAQGFLPDQRIEVKLKHVSPTQRLLIIQLYHFDVADRFQPFLDYVNENFGA